MQKNASKTATQCHHATQVFCCAPISIETRFVHIDSFKQPIQVHTMGARYRASNFVFDRVLVVAALCVLVSLVLSQRGDQRPFSTSRHVARTLLRRLSERCGQRGVRGCCWSWKTLWASAAFPSATSPLSVLRVPYVAEHLVSAVVWFGRPCSSTASCRSAWWRGVVN